MAIPFAFGGAKVAPKKLLPKVPKSTAGFGGAAGLAPATPSVPASTPFVPPSSTFNYGGDLTPQVDPSAFFTQLRNDPMYQGADVAYNTAIGSGRQSLADSIKQLVIRGGWGQQLKDKLPSSLSSYGSEIDPATIEAASANPLSSRAQLNQQLSRQQSDLAYELAGRGTLGGGGYATGNTQLTQGYDVASSNAMNQLLDTIGQGASNFGTYSANAASARDQAYAAAAARLAQMPATGPARMTPGGNPMDAIAAALPGDTSNRLANSILNQPTGTFDYNALDRSLNIPTQADILKQFADLYPAYR